MNGRSFLNSKLNRFSTLAFLFFLSLLLGLFGCGRARLVIKGVHNGNPPPGETPTPIPTPTQTLTPAPSLTPTPNPMPTPIVTPIPSPTPSPIPTPSPTPSMSPSPIVTPIPTPIPSPWVALHVAQRNGPIVEILKGSNLLLEWSSAYATSCVLRNGIVSTLVPTMGAMPVNNLQESVTFTLSCFGGNSQHAEDFIQFVVRDPSIFITANNVFNTYLNPLNGEIDIRWGSQDVTSCTDPFGGESTSGLLRISNLDIDTTYLVTCQSLRGEISGAVRVRLIRVESPQNLLANTMTKLRANAGSNGTSPREVFAGRVVPGVLRLLSATGISIGRIHNGSISNSSPCPEGWQIHFLNSSGGVIAPVSSDFLAAAVSGMPIPINAVRAVIGFYDSDYSDNEGFRWASSGSTHGCSFELALEPY